jgi:hypothetical protein
VTLCHKFCLEAFLDTTPAEWTFVEGHGLGTRSWAATCDSLKMTMTASVSWMDARVTEFGVRGQENPPPITALPLPRRLAKPPAPEGRKGRVKFDLPGLEEIAGLDPFGRFSSILTGTLL